MYKFFIEWKDEDATSSILVGVFEIKNGALFLYGAAEEKNNKVQAFSTMVIPLSSIRYFTYEQGR